MNISNIFFEKARQTPQAIALCEGRTSHSYAAFEQSVRATAAYFQELGIEKGDRVLIFVPMSLDLYRIVMATFQIGATAVFLDEWVSLERLRLCCRLADCKAFVADWKFRLLGFFIPEIRRIPIQPRLSFYPKKQLESIAEVGSEDTALITFTTGSTGTPKAARRTHAFLRHQFDALVRKLQPQPGDVVMTTLPIVLLVNFGTGASSVIARFSPKKAHRLRPSAILSDMDFFGVNTLIASPYFVKKLAENIENQDDTKNLQKVFTGGAPVFPTEAALYQRAFPQTDINVVYGSTEAEPIAAIGAERLQEKADLQGLGGLCVGSIDPSVQLRIIHIEDVPIAGEHLEQKTLPNGEIGEITVAGDHVLKAYYNNEAAFQRNKITVGQTVWHRTGDAGFIGPDGLLYLTGRCQQMIRREGRYLSPFLWEARLAESSLVRCGTLLEREGRLVLAVQPWDANTENLSENLAEILPQPVDNVVFVPKMPMDPRHHSKIDYEALRQLIP